MPGPTRIRIPAGTPPTPCKSRDCGMTIYFAKHPKHGKPHPVSTVQGYIDGARNPTETSDGVGFSHFIDCPKAYKFHSKGKQKDPAQRPEPPSLENPQPDIFG